MAIKKSLEWMVILFSVAFFMLIIMEPSGIISNLFRSIGLGITLTAMLLWYIFSERTKRKLIHSSGQFSS